VPSRLRRVPLPLALLLVAAAIAGTTWSLLKPAFQGPDEVSHFTYVQRIVERPSIPWSFHPTPDPRGKHTEIGEALMAAGFGPLINNVSARPLWTSADEAIYARAARGADRTLGGETSAFKNPPLYYLYEAVPYAVGDGGSLFTRLFLARLANVVLLLAALVFVWLLAGELLGRGLAQFVATAAVALVPQYLNIVGTVDPDNLLVVEWAAAFWLMTLVLHRGPRRRLLIWLAVVCAASALTHGRGLPLLLPAAMAVLLALARERGWRRVNPMTVPLVLLAVAIPVVLVWAGRGPKGNMREFASYVWQFYLPKLSFMTPAIGPSGYNWHRAFSDRLWGGFAHLEVVLPPDLADALFTAVRVGLVVLVVAQIVKRQSVRHEAATAVVFAAAVAALAVTLHLIAYRSLIGNHADPIITGRYLLPLIPLFGLAIGIVVKALPRAVAAPVAGVLLATGIALQLTSAGLLLERFYA
jgi:4-amino-4-deoxy-L-arabinose transferase-like glycosyltransferase